MKLYGVRCRESVMTESSSARVWRRLRAARVRSELDYIRRARRRVITLGPAAGRIAGEWSACDLEHLLRLNELGVARGDIAMVLQRSVVSVKNKLVKLSK